MNHPVILTPFLWCFSTAGQGIEPLREGKGGSQPYHVIVLSLPGYGFSDLPTGPGFGTTCMGDALNELMVTLGYSNYVRTDWGSVIVRYMGSKHHQHCSAIHCTLFSTMPPVPTLHNPWHHPTKVVRFLLAGKVLGFDHDAASSEDADYRAIQATRPSSLAYGLSDSPIGLLGWMLEKVPRVDGSRCCLATHSSPNEFLTQVSIYWLTNIMSPFIRLYYEFFHQLKLLMANMDLQVPMGISIFKNELSRMPQEWIEMAADLLYFAEHSVGGHFATMETPDLLVSDLQSFGNKISFKLKWLF